MTKKEIRNAIDRTIKENSEYRIENPDDDFAIIAMVEYRGRLERNLNLYDNLHPSPLRVIATSIATPIGFVLSPFIGIGCLAYLAGKKIYGRIQPNNTT